MSFKIKKKLFLLSLVSVVLLSLVLFLPSEFNDGVAQLTLVQNNGVSCKIWSVYTDNDSLGNQRTYNAITSTVAIFTQFNVLSSGTGNPMNFIDTSTYVECQKNSASTATDFYLVGGKVSTKFYGTNENGQSIFLKQVDREISTVPHMVLNQKQSIPSGIITGSEINSKLTSSTEIFSTKITVYVTAEMQFKSTATGTHINIGNGFLSGSIPIKLYNPITTPTAPTSSIVDLTSVSPSVFDLKNYKTSLLTVSVKGQLPQWKDTEGVPYINLFDPTGKLVGKYPMTYKTLISSSTNTYEFQPVSLSIPKSPLGIWNIVMHSNNDIRKSSSTVPSIDTMILKTYDTSIPTITPTITPLPTSSCMQLTGGFQQICLNDDEFKLGGVCYQKTLQQCVDILNKILENSPQVPLPNTNSSSILTSVSIAYKLTYDQGGIEVGQIPTDGSVKVELLPLDFIAQPKGENEKLQTVTLIQSVDAKPLSSSTISNLQTDTKLFIEVDGTSIGDKLVLNAGQLKRIGTYSTDKTNYLMNQISLNSYDVKQFLVSNNYMFNCADSSCKSLTNGQKITVKTVTDGTFDVLSGGITKHVGFSNLIFSKDFTYSTDFNAEPCIGLSGESLLACQGADPSNNCVDLIDVIGDENCNIKESQTGGSCQGLTLDQCAAQGKNNPGTGLQSTDDPICSIFKICNNNSGSSASECLPNEGRQDCIDRLKESSVKCPNGSFSDTDSKGNVVCLDNTKRTPVTPLSSGLILGFDMQMAVILVLIVVFIILVIILLVRRRK